MIDPVLFLPISVVLSHGVHQSPLSYVPALSFVLALGHLTVTLISIIGGLGAATISNIGLGAATISNIGLGAAAISIIDNPSAVAIIIIGRAAALLFFLFLFLFGGGGGAAALFIFIFILGGAITATIVILVSLALTCPESSSLVRSIIITLRRPLK
jgi:hypothetical protein